VALHATTLTIVSTATSTHTNVAAWRIAMRAGWIAVAAAVSLTAHASEPPIVQLGARDFRQPDAVTSTSFSERVSTLRASILRALVQGGKLLRIDTQQTRFDEFAPKAFQSFDSNNSLFLPSTEDQYRDTLRLLIAQQQVRVSLRNDLHVACELNQYQGPQREPEPALKLALQFRFK
jgi:hypothetical protein